MKPKVSKKQLILLIVFFPLSVLLIYGFVSYLFINYMQENDISMQVAKYEKAFVQSQKHMLQEKVDSLSNFIHYYDKKMTDEVTTDLQNSVALCASVADNLYRARKGRDAIRAALKNLRPGGDMTPLFIMNTTGYVYQHFDKSLQGKIILDIRDDAGREFVKDFNRIIRYEKAGYDMYSWYKPDGGRDIMYEQLVYIQKLAYGNWYIGAGFFLDDLQNRIKKDVLTYIGANALFEHGFFYILDKDHNIIFCPEDKASSSLKEYADPGMHQQHEKIFYSKYMKSYGWYIVGMKDLSDKGIDTQNVQVYKGAYLHSLKKDLFLLGVALFASILLSLYLSYVLYRHFKSYEAQINDSHEKMMFRTKQALIGELFSMIAHQWRQPINKIASIVALMRTELLDKNVSKAQLDIHCEEIEESVEYMSETIEDFRTFYKPTSRIKVVDLKELIEKSVAFLNNSIEKKRITVIQKLAEGIKIKLYRNEFLQVMLNLIKNAIDATDMEGVITIRLHRHDRKIIISVENSGEPISEEVMRKIFQPYFTTKKDSMGLGLYMTKIIVEKHMKGEILIERLPEGTKFLIVL